MKKENLINQLACRHFSNDQTMNVNTPVSQELETAIQLLIHRLRELGTNEPQ